MAPPLDHKIPTYRPTAQGKQDSNIGGKPGEVREQTWAATASSILVTGSPATCSLALGGANRVPRRATYGYSHRPPPETRRRCDLGRLRWRCRRAHALAICLGLESTEAPGAGVAEHSIVEVRGVLVRTTTPMPNARACFIRTTGVWWAGGSQPSRASHNE